MRSLVLLLVAVAVAPAAAHPGRLDAEGCHQVTTRFVHRSGKIDEPGTRHCHRRLDQGLVLDGKEQLQDAPAEPVDRRTTTPPSRPTERP